MTIENRKANYDYFIEDKIECGISLKGNEVKSIHNGMCNIKDSWCQIQTGEYEFEEVTFKEGSDEPIFKEVS